MKKYICPEEHYPNCRGHEGGYFSCIKFFESKKELLDYALEFIAENVLLEIYNPEGNIIGKIDYEIDCHNCTGIKIRIEEETYRTMDNGHGVRIWGKL